MMPDMDNTIPAERTADPIALLRDIDPDNIRDHLARMERERRALLVLLRAACRMAAPRTEESPKGGRTNG